MAKKKKRQRTQPDKVKRAVLYARVSTLTQRDNETINSQLETLREYCQEHGYEIQDEYIDDGISGADEERAFRLLDYLQEHRAVKFLVMTYLDRMARNLQLQLWVEKECRKNGVEIIATEQDMFNNSSRDPLLKAMRQIVGVFAELEKDMITARMKRGRSYKAKVNRIKSQGTAPLGYDYVGDGTKEKHLELVKAEAKLVREIFDTYVDCGSAAGTARRINARGYRTRRGNEFSRQAIAKIISNDFYTGLLTYNGEQVDGHHPAIISKILFNRAQAHRIISRSAGSDR